MNPSRAAARALNRVLLAGLVLTGPALAKTGDAELPIEIKSEHSGIDNKTGYVVYTGKVLIVQGSRKVRANKVTLVRDANNELDTVIAEGDPAIFNQLSDKNEAFEGAAKRIDYQADKERVIFQDEVKLNQDGNTTTANRVVYDSAAGTVQSTGTAESLVHSIIQPRKKKVPTPASDDGKTP